MYKIVILYMNINATVRDVKNGNHRNAREMSLFP